MSNARKTNSIYGFQIKNALLKEQPWLQAEKLPRYLPFFVKLELLDEIRSNSNHLICGRRGTGKTHILGAFDEKINSDSNTKSMSVMISALEFSQTPPPFYEESVEFSRVKYSRQLFEKFLSCFVKKLIESTKSYIETKIKNRDKSLNLREIEKKSDDKLLSLLQEIDDPKPVINSGTFARAIKRTKKRNIGGEVAVDLGFEDLSGKLSFSGGKSQEGTEDESRDIVGNLSINLNKIREILVDLVKLLKIEILYILIDEWAELDKNLNLGIQPYFAQLIKMVFFNERRFAVKIASIWHRTDLYDRDDMVKSKGLELGEDIELGIDLDTAFLTSEQEVVSFFKETLFKRISYIVPSLEPLKINDNDVEDLFIQELFDDMKNFKSLIAASHGIPRDFFEIFNKCSLKINRDFQQNCIDRNLINKVAQNIYLIEKRKSLDKNSSAQNLYDRINKYMDKTQHTLFIVTNREAKESLALRKLCDEELIHPIPSSITPRLIRDQYKVFKIDYGNYIDWTQLRNIPIDDIDQSILPAFPENFNELLSSYELIISDLIEYNRKCENCQKEFSHDNPVYKKLGGCPFCGEKLSS